MDAAPAQVGTVRPRVIEPLNADRGKTRAVIRHRGEEQQRPCPCPTADEFSAENRRAATPGPDTVVLSGACCDDDPAAYAGRRSTQHAGSGRRRQWAQPR